MNNISTRIEWKINEIKRTAEDYPGAVVVQNIQELRILYMSDFALKGIGITMEEVRNMTFEEYHAAFFNPEDAEEYTPKIVAMLGRRNPYETISFFQQVRTGQNGDWEWYLTSMKVIMNDDAGNPLLTLSFAIRIDPQNHITKKVNRLLEENNFLRNHLETFSSLGKREKEVLRLLAMGRSNPEIARELFISEMTVRTHRKNINKKLNLKSAFDLQQYARAFDLI